MGRRRGRSRAGLVGRARGTVARRADLALAGRARIQLVGDLRRHPLGQQPLPDVAVAAAARRWAFPAALPGPVDRRRSRDARRRGDPREAGGPRSLRGVLHSRAVRLRGARMKDRSEEHTSELQSHLNLVCRLLLEKKKKNKINNYKNKNYII